MSRISRNDSFYGFIIIPILYLEPYIFDVLDVQGSRKQDIILYILARICIYARPFDFV